jgi:hypothetical protein
MQGVGKNAGLQPHDHYTSLLEFSAIYSALQVSPTRTYIVATKAIDKEIIL